MSHSDSMAHTERFQPQSKEIKAKEQNIKKLLKKDGRYDLSNNVYNSSGYNQQLLGLGEDPLSSVRTLRSYLKKRSDRWNLEDRPVAETLCHSACEKLDEAEVVLLKLQADRTKAIVSGEIRTADSIKSKMENYKNDVVRSTLADLVIDSTEMKAFGIDSAWTPDRSFCSLQKNLATINKTESTQPQPLLKRSERFKPRTAVASKNNLLFAEFDEKVEKMDNKNYDKHEVRRNERLSELMGNTTFFNEPRVDNPYDIPRSSIRSNDSSYFSSNPQSFLNGFSSSSMTQESSSGTCSYCGYTGFHLMSPAGMAEHHKRECKIMNVCRFCQKIVLVPQLTDHHITKCSFLRDRMTRCISCNLAVDKVDQNLGLKHPLCRGKTPPHGTVWCPLCAVAVIDNPESWKDHLVSKCYVNPRKHGPETLSDSTDFEQPKNGQATNMNGRFIDADKLVAALQEIQKAKKKKRMEALADNSKT